MLSGLWKAIKQPDGFGIARFINGDRLECTWINGKANVLVHYINIMEID